MPDPALPTPDAEIVPDSGLLFTREFYDPQGRPYAGHVTARRLTPPHLSTEGEILDGRFTLRLEPGRYAIGASLRDPDGVRAYTSDEITITDVREDS